MKTGGCDDCIQQAQARIRVHLKTNPYFAKHYVIVRGALCIDGELSDDWRSYAAKMYNKHMRHALSGQSCQDFDVLTLVDKSCIDKFTTGKLKNETIIEVSGLFPKCRVGIADVVRPYIKEDRVIITRLDIDDEVPEWFIETVQAELSKHMPEFACDIYDLKQVETQTGKEQMCVKYNHMTSPFISTIENRPHPIIPYSVNNEDVRNEVGGFKLKGLYGIQNITGNNKSNKWHTAG